MRSLLFLSGIILLLSGCETDIDVAGAQKAPGLKVDSFTVVSGKDTIIHTRKGARITIPADAFSVDDGTTVLVEIQEAYNIHDIILAGNLRTSSNGEHLSSGGMIYFNATAEEKVEIKNPIGVSIPTEFYRDGMQLYKGEKDENGNINWKEPKQIAPNPEAATIESGKVLFQANCSTCHAIGKNMTGPNLAHFPARFKDFSEHDLERLVSHTWWKTDTGTAHPEWERVASYRCNLKRMFGSVGTQFPNLKGEDFEKLVKYIQQESDNRQLPLPEHASLMNCIDSCILFRQQMQLLNAEENGLKSKRQKIENDAENRDRKKTSSTIPALAQAVGDSNFVSTQISSGIYYDFEIDAPGWYNIDMLLKNIEGIVPSELIVRITGEFRKKVQVFLIIPSMKVYVEGGYSGMKEDEFAFYERTGGIPLPQQAKAYILAVTESGSAIAFGLQEFTTSRRQELEISLYSSSKEQFNKAIRALPLEAFSVMTFQERYDEMLRKSDSLVVLRPIGCDCDCGDEGNGPDIVNQ